MVDSPSRDFQHLSLIPSQCITRNRTHLDQNPVLDGEMRVVESPVVNFSNIQNHASRENGVQNSLKPERRLKTQKHIQHQKSTYEAVKNLKQGWPNSTKALSTTLTHKRSSTHGSCKIDDDIRNRQC
jgi:hypothetical protein